MNIAILRRHDRTDAVKIYPGLANSATVSVKYLRDDERAEVFALAARLEAEGRDKETAHRIAFGRIAVKGWTGINDGDEPLPFCEENVDFLMLEAPDFRNTVLTSASSLQRAIEKN